MNRFISIVRGLEDCDFRHALPPGYDYNRKPLVSVWILTYNHAKYVRECLDGVLRQRVNFPYEVLIADDSSTDGTQEIVLEYAERYPDLIRPILGKENLFSSGRYREFEQLLPLSRGKYLTMCEGDDYWTFPGRMQALADFLESHPDHTMCFHGYHGQSEVPGLAANYPVLRMSRDVGKLEALVEPHIHYASCMGRINTLRQDIVLRQLYERKADVFYDSMFYASWLNSGKVYGFAQVWSIYRLHSAGVFTRLTINGEAEERFCGHLKILETLYDGKYAGLVQCRKDYVDLRKRLDNWTHARRVGKYLKAVSRLLKAFWAYPALFCYIYRHRYFH